MVYDHLQDPRSLVAVNSAGVFDLGNTNQVEPDAIHLMEYTGVDDTQGLKIWEDDVVSTGGNNYRVIFQHGFFGLSSVEFPDTYVDLLACDWKGRGRQDLLVRGNIHENPELLKS